jgi:hypothetical protein
MVQRKRRPAPCRAFAFSTATKTAWELNWEMEMTAGWRSFQKQE